MVAVEEAAAWPSGLSAVEGCVVESVSRAIFPLLCCSIANFMPTRRLTVVYLDFPNGSKLQGRR